MELPAGPRAILERLTGQGYTAYVVGGCVRDAWMGKTPEDWDVCTSARPEEVERCFAGERVVETGLKHGTVTVLLDGRSYEITTFRREGNYPDHRRPERVEFVTDLEEDLARRDFTVNAMALGLDGNIQDPFGGRADLEKGLLRCVGDPEKRFREDALRILRGLRFSARLGFSIEERTAAAMEKEKHLLSFVSGERIYKELTGLLTGPYAARVLEEEESVLEAVLPEIGPMVGFAQRNPAHDKDVWRHTVAAVGASPPDPLIRWTLLLHDVGKPGCFTLDENGVGHFYGHANRSAEMAEAVFTRLRADRRTRETVCLLVRDHDRDAAATEKTARRWIARYGKENVLRLLEIRRCDGAAHAVTPGTKQCEGELAALKALILKELEEKPFGSVRDLEVSGRDVMALGVKQGPEVGNILCSLVEDVLEGRCPNEREALLTRLREYLDREGPGKGCQNGF